MRRLLLLLVLLAQAMQGAMPGVAQAAARTGDLCLVAAERAAARHGVPKAVMRALTRTETGRNRNGALEPWPWTTNMEGKGVWFKTRAEAVTYIEKAQARGARSFDVGCFQLNHIYHAHPFRDIDHMIEPQANADYAAGFIRSLYDEFGDWASAAGAYHSRTPHYMDRYRKRFEQVLARGEDGMSGAELALAQPGVIPDQTPDKPPKPDRALSVVTDGRRARPEPVLWRMSEAAAPATAGGVAVKLLRGGLSPLRAAARPLIE